MRIVSNWSCISAIVVEMCKMVQKMTLLHDRDATRHTRSGNWSLSKKKNKKPDLDSDFSLKDQILIPVTNEIK